MACARLAFQVALAFRAAGLGGWIAGVIFATRSCRICAGIPAFHLPRVVIPGFVGGWPVGQDALGAGLACMRPNFGRMHGRRILVACGCRAVSTCDRNSEGSRVQGSGRRWGTGLSPPSTLPWEGSTFGDIAAGRSHTELPSPACSGVSASALWRCTIRRATVATCSVYFTRLATPEACLTQASGEKNPESDTELDEGILIRGLRLGRRRKLRRMIFLLYFFV